MRWRLGLLSRGVSIAGGQQLTTVSSLNGLPGSGVPGAKVINGDGLRGVGRGAASSHRHQVMEKVRVSTAGDDVRQGLIGRGGTGEEDLLTAHSERLVGSLWLMEL